MKTREILFSYFLIVLLCCSSESFSQLSGTYVIGSGGNYETINSAVNDLVNNGVNGPVIFNIKTGSYLERVTIDSIHGSSSENKIIFQSQTGNQEDVLWHYYEQFADAAIVSLVKADYITFKNITFQFDFTIIARQYVFYLSLNCDGINLLNNKITTVGGIIASYGIYSDRASTRNLTIKGNTIESIISIDLTSSNRSSGTQIINNHISGQSGVFISNHDSMRIEENIIDPYPFNVINRIGLSISNCNENLSIVKNKIISNGQIRYNPSSGIGISNCVFQNSLIANNFVFYVGGGGLTINNSSGLKICFNTIRTPGNYPPDYSTNLTLNNTTECIVKNNILGGTSTNFMNNYNSSLSSDYNCFYPNDSTESPHILYYNESGYSNIEQFRSVSNNDFHSLIRVVDFAAVKDFHLAGSSIGDTNLLGTPIPDITDDIDGQPRNPLYPYMGADEADMVLPVELSSFTSTVISGDVLLNWKTLSENNNSGFTIERTVAGIKMENNWSAIGFVNGSGTISSPKDYSFKDKNLNSGKYKYRLKQIDFNGNYQYFNLSGEADVGLPEKFSISQNYPNPFNPITTIEYQVPVYSFVSVKIYDASGKEVMALVNEKQNAGYYELKLNGAALSSGVYFYRIESGNYNATKKMLLLK